MGAEGMGRAYVVYTTLPVIVESTGARSWLGEDTKANGRPFDGRPL